MQKIALLKQEGTPHSYESYVANKLSVAFKKIGVHPEAFTLSAPEQLSLLLQFQPCLTLSCTDILFSELDRPLCDEMGIAHIHWAQGSLVEALPYLQSKKGSIAAKDPHLAESLDLLFLPDAVDTMLCEEPQNERPYEVVIFARVIDIEVLKREWEKKYTKEQVAWLHEHAAIDPLPPAIYPKGPLELIHEVETLQRAKRTLEMIESLSGYRVDVFGHHQGGNWLTRLKNRESLFLHPKLPFSFCLSLLKKSKLFAIDHYDAPQGSHFWFLHALACGALPITNGSGYLKEHFKGSFYYPTKEWSFLQRRCLFYLSHESKRCEMVNYLQKNALPKHSFYQRATELVEQLKQ